MRAWFKKWLQRYDDWCESAGLTPKHRRSCVPYRSDPYDPFAKNRISNDISISSSTDAGLVPTDTHSLIDTHCHLDFSPFQANITIELERAKQQGVKRFIVPAISRENWSKVARLADENQEIYYALGVHPAFICTQEATLIDDNYLLQLKLELEQALQQRSKKCVAIGECGLEKHSHFSYEQQRAIFAMQIELATQYRLPLILHNRQSHAQIISLLQQYSFQYGGVIHAFSGSYEQAMCYIQLGFYIGVGGVITYPRANKTRQAIARLPLSSLILETDAPDMPINGYRGEPNHPQRLSIILSELALLCQQSEQTIALQTWENSNILFNLS